MTPSARMISQNTRKERSGKLLILIDTILYSGSTLISQNIAFVVAIYIRHAVGPEAMGIWALLQVFLNYATYGNVGMLNAVAREVPLLRSKSGSEEKIQRIVNVGFTYLIAVGLITSALIVLAAFLFRNRFSEPMFYSILALAVINFLQRPNNYLIQLLHVRKQFKIVSKFKVYSAIVNAVLVVALTWKFNLYGLFIGSIFSYIFNIVYLQIVGQNPMRLQWNWPETVQLLRLGASLFLLTMANTFFNSIDKIAISKFLGLKALGIYTLATLAGSYIFMLPNVFQIVLYPRTLEKFGDRKDQRSHEAYSVVPAKLMSVYFALCTGICWILASYLCPLFLPKYVEGVSALKVMTYGYCFLALSQQAGHILIAYKRHVYAIPSLIALSLLVFWVSYNLLRMGGNVTHIAMVMMLACMVQYIVCAWLALKPIYTLSKAIAQIIATLIPLIYSASVLWFLDFVWPKDSFAVMLFKFFAYLVAWCVLLLLLEQNFGTFKILKEMLDSWRRSKQRDLVDTDSLEVRPL